MARRRDRVWITFQYIAKHYPHVKAESLKLWRRRGCPGLEDGGNLRHKPDPKCKGRYLHHHDDIKRIAALPCLSKDGRLKDADGVWLVQSAAVRFTGYNSGSLSRWRKYKCRPIGRKLGSKQVVVVEHGGRVSRVWPYHYPDLKALADVRTAADNKTWMTCREVLAKDPRITVQMLAAWRRQGCAALNGGRVRHVPDPHNSVGFLYLRRHIDVVAKIPSVANGRFTNARGTWLCASAVMDEYGIDRSNLKHWRRKACRPLGHRLTTLTVPVFLTDQPGLRMRVTYLKADLEEIAQARSVGYAANRQAEWLSAAEAAESLGLNRSSVHSWARKPHRALGKKVGRREVFRTYVLNRLRRSHRVIEFNRADLEVIVQARRERSARLDWLLSSEVRAEFGFSLSRLLAWRRACQPLGGRALRFHRSLRCLTTRETCRDAWEYRRADLEEIARFYKSEPDRYVDEGGTVFITRKRAHAQYGLPRNHEIFNNLDRRWPALGNCKIRFQLVHLPVKGGRAKLMRVFSETNIRDVAIWLNRHDTTVSVVDRTLHWGRHDFHLRAAEAACADVLVHAYKNCHPALSQATILQRAGLESERLDGVFRRHGGEYSPAWGKAIVRSSRGMYRIAAP